MLSKFFGAKSPKAAESPKARVEKRTSTLRVYSASRELLGMRIELNDGDKATDMWKSFEEWFHNNDSAPSFTFYNEREKQCIVKNHIARYEIFGQISFE